MITDKAVGQTQKKLTRFLSTLEARFFRPVDTVSMQFFQTQQVLHAIPAQENFGPLPDTWGGEGAYGWFRGNYTVPVELAMKCRSRGAYVIALTSLRHTGAVTPRNPMGKRLFEVADLVLDNGGALGDAAVEGTGGRKVGPTSTAVGSALLQAIVCRVEEIAREEGREIEFFASSNIDGGDEINEKLIEKYRGVIRGL